MQLGYQQMLSAKVVQGSIMVWLRCIRRDLDPSSKVLAADCLELSGSTAEGVGRRPTWGVAGTANRAQSPFLSRRSIMTPRKYSKLAFIAVLGVVAALSLGTAARADYTDATVHVGGTDTNSNWTLNSNTFGQNPITSGGGGNFGGTIDLGSGTKTLEYLYCVDIPDHVDLNTTYTKSYVSTSSPPQAYFDSNFNAPPNGNNPAVLVNIPNAGAIASILTEYGNSKNTSVQAGVQAAIWQEVYGTNFVFNTNTTGARPNTQAVINAYNAAIAYATANPNGNVLNFLWISPHSDGHQALVGFVPEPSSMAIAALGALGLVGYSLKRKRA